MHRFRRTELPYRDDSAGLFEAIADLPWSAFLDSGRPYSGHGRYDILVADPSLTLTTKGHVTEVVRPEGTECFDGDPFAIMRKQLERAEMVPDLPFCGGALGYFSYDLARRIERLPELARDAEHLPEMALGIYSWAVVVDHLLRRTWLAGHDWRDDNDGSWDLLCERFRAAYTPQSRNPFQLRSPLASNLDRTCYANAFVRIKDYIRDGDCYQVNLAQRFEARASGDPWGAYQKLRRTSGAPHGAFLNYPFGQVLSVSPERFLRVRAGEVETCPIKGTRPRGAEREADEKLAASLASSAKDRAENLMIVDLLRNDLGKNCLPGSIAVPRLFGVESYSSVHHLVSTVTGTLAPGRDALDLLRGCFPGGSITGAPKLRAMEIIEELEPNRRGVYCGAIGYIGHDGGMDTSVAIRSMVYSQGSVRFWAGGGIVADSQMESEYQETFDKVAGMFALLEGG
jgi:para-aminobenzoate synthetase component I